MDFFQNGSAGLAEQAAVKTSTVYLVAPNLVMGVAGVREALTSRLPIGKLDSTPVRGSEGEGCFYISIRKNRTKLGVSAKFFISQHSRDEELMKSLMNFFDCGRIERDPRGPAVSFVVTVFSDLNDKIITFFKNYRIEGVKYYDYSDFCKVVGIMKVGGHLTSEGLEEICKIKAEMNSNRILPDTR